jgi:hypothetical protein
MVLMCAAELRWSAAGEGGERMAEYALRFTAPLLRGAALRDCRVQRPLAEEPDSSRHAALF